MPGDDLAEALRAGVVDAELRAEILPREAPREVATEGCLAMLAQTVVTVEVVDDEAIDAPAQPLAHPGLEHLLPGGVAQAGPVLAHAADGIGPILDRRTVGVLLEKLQGIGDRLGAEHRLVPEVAVELEEPAGPFRAIGVPHQELDVEV